MTGARSTAQSFSSKRRCTNCRRRIASMSATTTVAGCKSGASTSSTRRSARSWGRPPGQSTMSIWFARPPAEPYRCGGSSKTGDGNKIEQLDLSDYGYDARKRGWYRDTMQTDRAVVSSPYASFSIGTPMITLSAPLQGHVHGVIAADLKLDKFSDLVYAQTTRRAWNSDNLRLVRRADRASRLCAARRLRDARIPPTRSSPRSGKSAAGWSAQ